MTFMKPVITEKSMLAARRSVFTFQVDGATNKSLVKQLVEKTFKVNVIRVNMSIHHQDAKRTGAKRLLGVATQIKHALVSLKSGQKIDLFDLKEEK
jgi:ribosomal protein L23